MPADPLVTYIQGPYLGQFQIGGLLADQIAPSQAPYEGLWTPLRFAKQGTVEVFGVMSTLSMDIWGTNQISPLNQYNVAFGGSATNNDTVSLTFNCPNLPNGNPEVVTIPITTAETTTQMATAMAAAINGDVNLAALGITATSSAANLKISWPSTPGAAANLASPPVGSTILLAFSATGAATETGTITVGNDGVNLTPSHITALGLTSLTTSLPVNFIKARIPTLTGAGATISASLCSAP